MESIEFAKRHFNGSNDYIDDHEDDSNDISREYENVAISTDQEANQAFSAISSSRNNVPLRTELSFEEEVAYFPIS